MDWVWVVCPVKQGHMSKINTRIPVAQSSRPEQRVCWYVGSVDVYTCHADVMHSILILASTRVPIRRQLSIVRGKKNCWQKLGHKQFLIHFNLKTDTNLIFSIKKQNKSFRVVVVCFCQFLFSEKITKISVKQFAGENLKFPRRPAGRGGGLNRDLPPGSKCCVQWLLGIN